MRDSWQCKNVDANLYNNGGGTDFHDMKVMPDGTAYIYGYVLFPSSEGFVSHIYQTTVSNLLSENPEDWTEIYAEKVPAGLVNYMRSTIRSAFG